MGDEGDGGLALAEAQGRLDRQVDGDRVVGDQLEGVAVAAEGLGVVAGLLLGALAVLDPGRSTPGCGVRGVAGLAGEGVLFVGEAGDGGAALGGLAHDRAAGGEQALAEGALAELLEVDPTCLSGHGRTDSFVAVGLGLGE
ncbi:MAG: hypothetical protein IPO88_27695 [Nannocystis sp.]|uniref:hypothetical protein n=1 Tax=Nannocystis sp. TaxID=1962667 RepID=UPI002421E0C4|nr:hypothetical protein [Nannocystis sp.]MBK9757214.1 hypothetical protein [Nannocystis sp.]